jgi:glutamate racemase
MTAPTSPDVTSPAPIGVFDSGVGGLTVLAALERDLPAESFVYLGDTARVPYGTRSADVVTRYALRAADLLVSRGVKALVVACNTVSAVALDALRDRLSVPVVGVIDPVAAQAAQLFPGGRVGVIGTAGTIRSGAYQRALARLSRPPRVFTQACPLFVPLAEEPGWIGSEVLLLAARRYLQALAAERLDALVLGCTHYPLLREAIATVMGPQVALLDSGVATAAALRAVLADAHLGAEPGRAPTGTVRFLLTDLPQGFEEVGSRFLGRPLVGVDHVDL